MIIIQGSGNLRLAVRLPDGEDLNEWLAVHGNFIRLQPMIPSNSGFLSSRFFQSRQYALWNSNGVLHTTRG